LLVNSVLFSTVLYPKLLIDFLSEKQIISYPACLFQFFMYYSFGLSEFFLLTVMAYDRYVSICKPLQYPAIMTKTTVSILVVLAWLLPACDAAVPAALSSHQKLCYFTVNETFCNNSIYKLHCVTSKAISIFGVVILLFTLLPVFFTLFTYARILIITYQSSRDVRKKAAQTCLPHLLVFISIFILGTYDILRARLESNFPKTAHLRMILQVLWYHPLFNPIIYGLKMKVIYKHLRQLFCEPKL
ncbi:hypothetical protein LDENG_00191800, partial [Lucifuga dentata]